MLLNFSKMFCFLCWFSLTDFNIYPVIILNASNSAVNSANSTFVLAQILITLYNSSLNVLFSSIHFVSTVFNLSISLSIIFFLVFLFEGRFNSAYFVLNVNYVAIFGENKAELKVNNFSYEFFALFYYIYSYY